MFRDKMRRNLNALAIEQQRWVDAALAAHSTNATKRRAGREDSSECGMSQGMRLSQAGHKLGLRSCMSPSDVHLGKGKGRGDASDEGQRDKNGNLTR